MENAEDSAAQASSEALAETSETASEAASEPEESLFAIWEYEGYVDECELYSWKNEFAECDYDGDGKRDRVSRSWDGTAETAVYEIEFGNGDELITPEGWETGFPHVESRSASCLLRTDHRWRGACA